MRRTTRAQSLIEYTVLIGIVTVVLFAMFNAVKRGIQSVIKVTADQVGNQQRADQIVTRQDSGYLVESYSATRINNRKQAREISGDRMYIYDEGMSVHSNSFYNLGFNPRANN